MAVVSTKVVSVLKLTMKTGIDINGNNVFVTKSLGSLRVTAADEDVFSVGQAISKIKTYPLVGIDRQDQYSLINE